MRATPGCRAGFKGASSAGQVGVAIHRQTAVGSPLEAFVTPTAPSVQEWTPALPRAPGPLERLRPMIASLTLPRWVRRRIGEILGRHGHESPADFSGSTLAALGVRYLVDQVDRERLPARGPVIVVANHPCGGIEALALLHWIGQVRRDVRVLANQVLLSLPPLAPALIPVDVFGRGSAREAMRCAGSWLDQGGCLLVFPAGEVARLGPFGLRDAPWRRGFVSLAQRHRAPVLPVHVAGRNSVWFYGASMLHPALGTLMLPRELLRPVSRELRLRVGLPDRVDAHPSSRVLVRRFQQLVEQERAGSRSARQPAAIAWPRPGAAWLRELQSGERLYEGADGRVVWRLRLTRESALLHELGRARELAFRAVGEGCGLPVDHDAHDLDYEHLILVDHAALSIAGAYRLGRATDPGGLYCGRLFDLGPQVRERLPQAAELGRSFVDPRWFRTRALDELWRGIGAWLARHPEVRYLFGPVSISAALPDAARRQLLAWCEGCYGRSGWARGRHPVEPPAPDVTDPADALKLLRAEFERLGVTIPPLFRQYVDLVEPDGVRFLAYSRDPDFADCIDALVWLDLTRLKPAKRARYLALPT